MFDAKIRPYIDPPLNFLGRILVRLGVSANGVTFLGLGFGLGVAGVIALGGAGLFALLPLLINRILDGLDGAVARASEKTDFGGYLDIFCDFIFYAAIPLAFALRDPAQNALVTAFLLFAFYVNAASFLGFAIMAEKRRMQTTAQGQKSLYYASGLLEGAETIAFFIVICLWPAAFVPLAWCFGVLCLFTAIARVIYARGLLLAR